MPSQAPARLLAPALLAALFGILLPASQAGAAQTCSTAIKDSTITGDVSVEGMCTIEGSRVSGAVLLRPGASLTIRDSSVLGPVQGDRVKTLDVTDSRLDKGLVITGGAESIRLNGSSVVGAPAVLSAARIVTLDTVTIRESLTLKDGSGTLDIKDSSISNGLSCNRGVKYRAVGSLVSGKVNC